MRLGFAASLLLFAACSTVKVVPASEVARIRDGGIGEAVVLGEGPARVRIDPNTALRFSFGDGSQSEWFWASEVETSTEGVRGRAVASGVEEQFFWREIVGVEADNFSGSKTLAYLGANAALAVLLAPLALLGSFDVPGIGTAPAKIADAAARVVPAPASDREPALKAHASSSNRVLGGKPLFDAVAERKAVVRIVAAIDASPIERLDDGVFLSLFAGARFYDAFELGLTTSRIGADNYALSFRTGAHFHLDGDHFFAIPLFLEVGGGPGVDSTFRAGYGARIRFTRDLFGGVYAFNPRYTNLSDGARGWTFAHGFELGATF